MKKENVFLTEINLFSENFKSKNYYKKTLKMYLFILSTFFLELLFFKYDV